MTHGRKARTVLNARTKKRSAHLTGSSEGPPKQATEPLASLEARIAALEQNVAALWEVVNRLDGVAPSYFYTGIEEAKDKKPGPDKSIEDAEL